MTIRLLHTADWQIGKLFKGVDGDAGALLRDQRFKTVDTLVRLAAARNVDAVVVAGDVFETDTVDDRTLRRVRESISASEAVWLLLPGNHDAARPAGVWDRFVRLNLPSHVHVLVDSDPRILLGGRLAILPAPLKRRHEPRDLTEAFDSTTTPKEAVRVGVAHGSVKNRLPERSEAANSISDVRAERASLDYLALGDWHGTFKVGERCYYSGTPEPDGYKDNNPGNALVVEIDEPRALPRVDVVRVGHYSWHEIESPVRAESDLEALDARLQQIEKPWTQRVVKLRLQGTIDFATGTKLRELLDRWRATYHAFDVDQTKCVESPSGDDLIAMRGAPLLYAAAERLQRTVDQSKDERESRMTRAALHRLYEEYVRAEGS